MIITTFRPYTKKEIITLQEEYGGYIKTVIDLQRKVCSAGADRHLESENILLDEGSKHLDTWSGGVYVETKAIDFHAFVNRRPADHNTSDEIQDPKIRELFTALTKYFFAELL